MLISVRSDFEQLLRVVGMCSGVRIPILGTRRRARPFVALLQGFCLMLSLGGCLLTGDKIDPALDIPQVYDGGPKNPVVAEAAVPPLDWWRGFRSKELTEVIEEARAANLDIAAAIARIVQADAQARVAGAPLLPNVALNGSASHSRSSQSLGGGAGGGASEHDFLSGSLTASYEIDFWGKNRAALRAGPAVRTSRPAPRHPRGGSQSRRCRCQCGKCACAVPAQHHAHRRGRLPERYPAHAAAAGIGVLHAHRRPDAADLRRPETAGQSRLPEGQAGRASADLPQGGDLGVFRRGDGARRHPPDRVA